MTLCTDIMLRIRYPENYAAAVFHTHTLDREFARLQSRLQRTPMRRDGQKLMLLLGLAPAPDPENNRSLLLDCVEGLFTDV